MATPRRCCRRRPCSRRICGSDGGQYRLALFHCQQALEKALKAAIVHRTGEKPPRMHNLLRLAQTGDLQICGDVAMVLREIGMSYIESRYPDASLDYENAADANRVSGYLIATREVHSWLLGMLE